MTLLAGENILKRYSDYIIFEELSFSIGDNDRIGLVGPNGIGKTTLFEIMTGNIRPDQGKIVKPKSSLIGYVEQEIIGHDNTILLDFVATAREDILKLKADIDRIAHELEENPESHKTLEKLGNYQHRFETEGGYAFESEIKIILAGLGFPKDRFQSRISSFSGGEKNRASLARLLAGRSNLLLLDEPTNHLDIESTIWLEEYLKSLNKSYIIVSHDRTFLANTIDKVWEITSKKIDQYFNGFDKFLVEREERRRLKRHIFKHQQDEIRQIEYFIRKNMAGQKTKQAQSKQKYLERMEKFDLPESEQIGPSFAVESGQRSHNLVLAIEDASFGYGHRPLISDVNLNIYRTERIGLIGVNGSGKTTILKTILGEVAPITGSVKVGNKVDVAYFDQGLAELNNSNTILDELWQIDRLADSGRLRSFLAQFGFRGEEVFKKISILSGGEKTKLALAKLLFLPANFLIFDEPTNHLDIDARQALEDALKDYNGTLLVVSHDRYFLDRVTQRIAVVENDSVKTYDGNYSYYKEKTSKKIVVPKKKKVISKSKIQEYKEFKNQSRSKGKLKKDLRSTESKIKDNESTLVQLEKDLNYNIPKTSWTELVEAAQKKSSIEEELLKLYSKLDELKKLNDENSDD